MTNSFLRFKGRRLRSPRPSSSAAPRLCFLGLLLAALAFSAGDARSAAPAGPTFLVGSPFGLPGQQVLVPVQVSNFSNIFTLQFSLHWEASNATYVGVEQFGLPLMTLAENFGVPTNGTVTALWDDHTQPIPVGQTVPDGTTIFAVRLLLTGPLGATNSLFIDGKPTAVEVTIPPVDTPITVTPVLTPGLLTIGQPNTPPVLAPIGDRTVDELSPLNFTATGTDTNLPAQTLTYSLDSGAPSGASIDPNTGAFAWTPNETQGGGTYALTVRVTDDGSPALSVFETITVSVKEVNMAPILTAIGDKTVGEGNLLTFTNSASDGDLPPQVLTFSLVTGAPASPSLNPATGVFSWVPPEVPTPTNYPMTVIVRDNGSPSLSATQSFTVTVLKTNNPPMFAPLSNYLAQVLIPIRVTNIVTDPDTLPSHLTFQLASGPQGVRVNPSRGVVAWVPSRSQARSTNLITVLATDDGTPPLSGSNTFAIIVGDYLELSLGQAIVQTGNNASVPITVTNTTGVTNLTAALFAATNRLTSLGLSGLASELRSGGLTAQGPGLSKLSFSVTNGQILQPAQLLGQLNFTAISTQSAFVPLVISNVVSIQSNGLPLVRTLAGIGRAVVVANEPLLEALPPTNPQPVLIIYGNPGSNYVVEYTLDSADKSNNWQTVWQGSIPTNLFQVLQPAVPTNRILFFRSSHN